MKQKFATLGMILASAALLVSCNADYKKTKTGITYKVYHVGKGASVNAGEFLKVHYEARIGDSVLFSTYGRIPAFGKYDTATRDVHDFLDFIEEMKVGDSAVYIRSVDTMMKKGYLMYNDVFKQGGTIKGSVAILGTYKDEAAMQADQEKESENELQREVAELGNWLKTEKQTGFEQKGKGVYVKVEKSGNGTAIVPGSTVSVNYTGSLKNGQKFDSNVGAAGGPSRDPLTFTVGAGGIIKGWDEAFVHLKLGDKAKIWIPAMLAYGGQANDNIPPFSDLLFDVEVVGVGEPKPAGITAPPAAPASASPTQNK